MVDFARTVPPEDRNFLKEDVADPTVVRGWRESSGVQRFVAIDGDAVVGFVALQPLEGWARHVSEMRVLVSRAAREHGYGQRLIQQALRAAAESATAKVVVEVIADHDRTLGLLQANGFSPEALLVDQVRDRNGTLRDLMLLSCKPDELVGNLATMGIEEAVL